MPRSPRRATSRTSGRSSPSRAPRRSTGSGSRSRRSRTVAATCSAWSASSAAPATPASAAASSAATRTTRCSLWDAILAAGVVPCGLGARDTLRLEACYPLHGHDIGPDRTPIAAGLGWACSLDKEFTGVEVLRREKEEGPAEKLVAFAMVDKGIPRAGMPIAEGGVVTSGTLSPMLDEGIGLAYVPADARRAGHRDHDRPSRPSAPRPYRPEAVQQGEGELMAADESYPSDLKYHHEHDWARIDGDIATLGHHLVRAGLPRRDRPLRGARGGRRDREGRELRRGRVGEGGVRRDRAALRAR